MHMVADRQRKNLQGHSFRHQDLSGVDFNNADIRGADFTRANLKGVNFSNAIAGVPRGWIVVLEIGALFLSTIIGVIVGFGAILPGKILSTDPLPGKEFLIIIGFFILAVFLAVLIEQGIGSSLGTIAIVYPLLTAIFLIISFNDSGGEMYDNILGAIVVQFVSLAFAITGVLAASVALGITISLGNRFWLVATGISFILGALLGGKLGGAEIRSECIFIATLIAGVEVFILIVTAFYLSFRALAGDKRYYLIDNIVVFICSVKGTNFHHADLTEADFTGAKLEYTNFTEAVLKRTCWFKVENLHLAHLKRTYLDDPSIRQLVVSKNGQDELYDYKDLRGLNLQQANLANASLIGVDLSETTLQDADLSRAKLVQTRLYGSNLTHAILTGVCIQDWAISTDTQLQQVRCEYVYMRLPTKEDPDPWRKPDNRQETFREGDFSDFITPIIKTLDLYRQQNVDPRKMASTFKTLDLYHYQGIDPTAATIALKQLAEQYPDAGLELVSLEGRGDEKVKLQAVVSDAVNQSQLSVEYFQRYREISALPYKDIQALLAGIAEKDDRIRSLEQMVNSAIQSNKYYVETYYQMGDTVSEKSSIDIKSGGDIGNISGIIAGDVSGVVNLGSISGNVTNTINQLPESTDPNQPSLKELLTQLQTAIESETELPNEDKAEALEQVKTLAETGQKPEDSAMQKAGKTAMKILKGTTAGLSETTKLVVECAKLLPAIAALLALV